MDGMTPGRRFLSALRSFDVEEARRLVQYEDVDPNTIEVYNCPAPHFCCSSGCSELLELFYENGKLDVELRDRFGDTLLHVACRNTGAVGVHLSRFLVETGQSNVEARNIHMETPLHQACLHSDAGVVRYLVEEAGANVDTEDYYGNTPLHLVCSGAMQNGVDDKVRILIARGDLDATNLDMETPFFTAVHGGNVSALRYLVKQAGANVGVKNYRGSTPLHATIFSNVLREKKEPDMELIEYLVDEAGVDVDARDDYGDTALSYALGFDAKGAGSDAFLYLARRSQFDDTLLGRVWISKFPFSIKAAFTDIFARRSLSLPPSYTSKFPVHVACQVPIQPNNAFLKFIEDAPSRELLVLDPDGHLPIHLAISTQAMKVLLNLKLFEKEPRAATVRDLSSGFYPFETAATRTFQSSADDYDDTDDDPASHLELVYTLFRCNPVHYLKIRGLGSDQAKNS